MSVCQCPQPSLCHCAVSQWRPLESLTLSQHGPLLIPRPPAGPQPQPHMSFYPPGAHPYYPPHMYQQAAPPLYPPVNGASYLPFPSPTPLQNAATSVVNTPTPRVGSTRKRKTAMSGGNAPAPKKSRTSAKSNPRVSVTPAAVVGVGPSAVSTASPVNVPPLPVNDPPSALPTSSVSSQPLPSTGDPDLDSDHTHTKTHRNTAATSATDVYYFLEPLRSGDKPERFPLPLNGESAPPSDTPTLLKSKPDDKIWTHLKCRLCTNHWQVWKNASGVTGSVRTHLREKHESIYWNTVRTLGLKYADTGASGNQSAKEEYSAEEWVRLLMRWVVVDDQSINVVNCEEFRDFVLFGREPGADGDLPHRTALADFIAKEFAKEHQEIIDDLQKGALGRISFTADIWSDPNLVAYMALTIHYCARDSNGRLIVKTRLLAFRVIHGSHDGDHLGDIIYSIWKEAGILHLLGQFTLDNASNNGTTMHLGQQLLCLVKPWKAYCL